MFKLLGNFAAVTLGVLLAEAIIWPAVAGYFVPAMTAMCQVSAALR